MTINEAIIQLRIGPGINEDVSEEYNEAVDIAIEALEAQPSEDCISRKAVLDGLHRYFAEGFNEDRWWNSTYVLDTISKAPSVTPQPNECKYCHEDPDGYVKPLEKNCHAYIGFGMHGWVIELEAKGWRGKAPIKFCPMCGRRLTNG